MTDVHDDVSNIDSLQHPQILSRTEPSQLGIIAMQIFWSDRRLA